MKKTNILLKFLLLCFLFTSISNQAQNSHLVANGNFESGESGVNNSGYSIFNGYGFEFNCNTSDFSEYSLFNTIDKNIFTEPATLIELNNPFNLNDLSNFEPQLLPEIKIPKTFNTSVYSLKLNNTNEHDCGNCSKANSVVLEKQLDNVTEDFLSLNFAMVFRKPIGSGDHVIARFEILDSNDNVLDSNCITSNNFSNDDDIDIHPTIDPTLMYIDWTCETLNVSPLKKSKKGGILRIIVSDYDKGHDTTMYLDNIGNNGNLCKPNIPCELGSTVMNPLNINCPKEPIIVSGNYILPACDTEDPTYIKLNLISFNPITGYFSPPITIDQNNFYNNSYSFTIDPSTLDTSLEYDLVVIANFSDGSTQSAEDSGKEITFRNCNDVPCIKGDCDNDCDDCDNDCDDCDNDCDEYWVAILDEYIDGTQSGYNNVYLMANGNYPVGANYTWTTTRQSGLVQTYSTVNDVILVSASINNRITSAIVTVNYEECSKTVSKIFYCAIPNSNSNGELFPECNGSTSGGFSKKNDSIKVSPNPIHSNESLKINGLESLRVEKIEILDLMGNIKSIHQLKSDTIRIGNLKPGIYFIKIYAEKSIKLEKIIIN